MLRRLLLLLFIICKDSTFLGRIVISIQNLLLPYPFSLIYKNSTFLRQDSWKYSEFAPPLSFFFDLYQRLSDFAVRCGLKCNNPLERGPAAAPIPQYQSPHCQKNNSRAHNFRGHNSRVHNSRAHNSRVHNIRCGVILIQLGSRPVGPIFPAARYAQMPKRTGSSLRHPGINSHTESLTGSLNFFIVNFLEGCLEIIFENP